MCYMCYNLDLLFVLTGHQTKYDLGKFWKGGEKASFELSTLLKTHNFDFLFSNALKYLHHSFNKSPFKFFRITKA